MSVNSELRKAPAPDGGWGWVVLAGSTVQTALYISFPTTVGLIFNDFFEQKHLGTQGFGIFLSVLIFTSSIFGMFSNYFITRWGYQLCGLVCAILQVIGSLATVFATQFWQLLIFYGFIGGIGGGLLFIVCFTVFNDYWDKRRSFTMSLLQLISGVISIAAPLFVEFLMRNYGFRGTLLITTGLFANLLPIAIIYRPVASPEKSSHFVIVQEENTKTTLISQITDIFDLTLLRDPVAANVIVGITLLTFADFMLLTMQPLYMMHIGYSRGDAAFCLTAGSFADVLARFSLTIIGFITQFNNRNVVFLGAVLSTVSRVGFMLVEGFYPLIIFSGLLGYGRGMISVPLTLAISDHVAQERFAAALAFYNFFFGFSVLLLSPIIGTVRDWTGSYGVAIHSLSALTSLVVISWLVEKYLVRNKVSTNVKDTPPVKSTKVDDKP